MLFATKVEENGEHDVGDDDDDPECDEVLLFWGEFEGVVESPKQNDFPEATRTKDDEDKDDGFDEHEEEHRQ